MAWKARARYSHAGKLFQQGIVRNIIVSGGVSVKNVGLTEAEWFKEELIALGVPADRIFLENQATNATENVEYALSILKQQGFTSIVLVMSDFTGIRAHLTAKRALLGYEIDIYNSHAPSSGLESMGLVAYQRRLAINKICGYQTVSVQVAPVLVAGCLV